MTKLVIQQGMYKKAAQNAQPTFQQQFGILTNAIIVDKFPNLSNYRVAFQLIQKNDENTKAIGVSVFKLDSQFILVPSFFNKGKIKTGDMMYIQSIDTFRPLSDAWLADVRNMKLAQSGEVVDVASAMARTQTPESIRVKQSTDPIIKSASMLQAVVDNSIPQYNIFNAAARLGKKASLALVRQLQQNTDFANSTIRFYGRQAVDEFVKLASEILADQPQLQQITVITPLDKQAAALSQEQRTALYRDGYFIKTAADTWQDSRDVLKATVVDTINNQFATPGSNCRCKILDIQGNLHDALVFVPQPVLDGCPISCESMQPSYKAMSNMLRDGASRYGVAPGQSVYCKLPAQVIAQTSSIDALTDSEAAGVELSGSVRDIPYQSMLITPSGQALLIHATLEYVGTGKTWASCNNKTVHVADTDIIRPIIADKYITVPKHTRIVFPSGFTEQGRHSQDRDGRRQAKLSKLKCCTVKSIQFALDNYKRKHYDKVKVYTEGTQYVVSDAAGQTKPMQAKEAALHIVRQYNVIPKVAKLMLQDTLKGAHSNKPKRNVFYITKKAQQDINWQRSNAAMTQRANNGPTVTNIDMDQFKQDPEQLLSAIQAATETGIRQVFDVTAMKLLVQAGDVSQYIGDYTTDFMRCLDKLCRLLFMVYWHSDAMQQKYGMLKLKSLQQSIKNALDSLSQLAVFLKLRGFGSVDSDTSIDGNNGLVSGEML